MSQTLGPTREEHTTQQQSRNARPCVQLQETGRIIWKTTRVVEEEQPKPWWLGT